MSRNNRPLKGCISSRSCCKFLEALFKRQIALGPNHHVDTLPRIPASKEKGRTSPIVNLGLSNHAAIYSQHRFYDGRILTSDIPTMRKH
jgi:hypothetical protein